MAMVGSVILNRMGAGRRKRKRKQILRCAQDNNVEHNLKQERSKNKKEQNNNRYLTPSALHANGFRTTHKS
jgi:hypothetical protein